MPEGAVRAEACSRGAAAWPGGSAKPARSPATERADRRAGVRPRGRGRSAGPTYPITTASEVSLCLIFFQFLAVRYELDACLATVPSMLVPPAGMLGQLGHGRGEGDSGGVLHDPQGPAGHRGARWATPVAQIAQSSGRLPRHSISVDWTTSISFQSWSPASCMNRATSSRVRAPEDRAVDTDTAAALLQADRSPRAHPCACLRSAPSQPAHPVSATRYVVSDYVEGNKWPS